MCPRVCFFFFFETLNNKLGKKRMKGSKSWVQHWMDCLSFNIPSFFLIFFILFYLINTAALQRPHWTKIWPPTSNKVKCAVYSSVRWRLEPSPFSTSFTPPPPRLFCPSASSHLSSRWPSLCFGLSAPTAEHVIGKREGSLPEKRWCWFN